MCVFTLGVGFSCSFGTDGGLLSVPAAPFLEETIEVPMWVGSSSSLSGLSTVDFFPILPRVFPPGVIMGFDFAGLVVWLLLALRSLKPPSRSTPFARFDTFWRFVRGEWRSPLVPSLVAALLG